MLRGNRLLPRSPPPPQTAISKYEGGEAWYGGAVGAVGVAGQTVLLRLSLYRQGWGHQKIPSFFEHAGPTTATKYMGQAGEEATGGRWMDDGWDKRQTTLLHHG